MVYNFFGGEITDSGYVEGNMEYAGEYTEVLNKNITRSYIGYVPLSRIMYFYNEDMDLNFDSIYTNNIDNELLNLKPISEVCDDFYNMLDRCKESDYGSEIDDYPYKIFNAPIILDNTTITSYFGQERIVYEEYDIHYAWDFAARVNTPVYASGDGVVKKVRFNQDTNTIDKSNGAGNYIEIEYDVDGEKYKMLYGHLYPNSATVKVGDKVKSWQKIGEVGTTGYSTGNHLHWKVTKDGKEIDGMNLVDFNNKIDKIS